MQEKPTTRRLVKKQHPVRFINNGKRGCRSELRQPQASRIKVVAKRNRAVPVTAGDGIGNSTVARDLDMERWLNKKRSELGYYCKSSPSFGRHVIHYSLTYGPSRPARYSKVVIHPR